MFLPSFQLQNKIALVTGAGRGIGRALAIGLAEAGADVALFARTASDIEEVAHEIRALGRKAYPFSVDVTNREQIEEAVQQIIEQTGRLDILVNNAGMNIRSQALAVTDEEWDTIMQTNLKSAFLCSQIVARHMQQKEYGRIINIASVAGQVALRTGVVYAATKAAMIQMTKVLALEWGKYGINVNSIGPWYFKTPLTEKILANPDYLAEIIARTPLRRVGELEELVGPAVFFASDAANYVTGQTLFVDGGMTIYGF
ncbi:3-oxoacyl-ACP reductase FabG [Paenibacillus alginolyticus]|uniref:3-oxoacyl-ACP reductase FabG n=1 Tax=Paenibacillus alginolyticus TaxID=59839 RepID=A0ABT4GLQ8_9BACL|nr:MULTISPECIES: 3-oxoacyl-ACP reductase family protein [Paenibacillus]MCY9665394.1 3-oxoacyl-ACP reductase FabG [Paenibacillus alginolyticus]MCY9696969.1 3-oxoacyl-ACP reductase FabG [Paenibacillus alginolyticus]MEC0147355.1 3-oxoacyl-ACP reductase FabG [Paenibacillus alginolyticus]NRF94876.1 3-oxoacyl-ACP reductase FabG [Paenibacillus frigoriresistens]